MESKIEFVVSFLLIIVTAMSVASLHNDLILRKDPVLLKENEEFSNKNLLIKYNTLCNIFFLAGAPLVIFEDKLSSLIHYQQQIKLVFFVGLIVANITKKKMRKMCVREKREDMEIKKIKAEVIRESSKKLED